MDCSNTGERISIQKDVYVKVINEIKKDKSIDIKNITNK